MSLQPQHVYLSEVARLTPSSDPSVFAGASWQAVSECFAFYSQPLYEQARDQKMSWHLWLLHASIIGLWEQSPKRKAYVCYTIHTGVLCLFFCWRQQRFPAKFYEAIRVMPGYMEGGSTPFPPERARPLAAWEPPSSAFALWPTGLSGGTDGPRVVDTGNLIAYFSYPEADHSISIPVDKAGPEYIRVPQKEHAELEFDGRLYRYLNRWAAVALKPSAASRSNPPTATQDTRDQK